ncbi:MAG: hypothetical protein RL235_494, partial [Chlamydiota bacterium]
MKDTTSFLNRFFARRETAEGAKRCLERLFEAAREGIPSIAWPEETFSPNVPVVRDGDHYYLDKFWKLETHLLQHLRRLKEPRILHATFDADTYLRAIQDAPLAEAQKRAMKHAHL